MRLKMTAMLAGLLFLPALPAADKPAAPAEQLEALKKKVETVRTEYSQAFEKAKTDKERQELRDKENKQIHACARRALELAQQHPKDLAAVDALSWIITGGLGYQSAGAEIETALDMLRTEHVASDKLRRVCAMAFVYDSVSTKPEKLLRAVVEKNPHRAIQGQACFSLARTLRRQASWAKRLRDPAQAKELEEGLGAVEVVKHLKASDPDKLLREAEQLLERTMRQYGDVKNPPCGTLGERAEATLFEIHHLVVGKPAPEIEGEDIDGKRFKLSDYQGKVVVVDFWGHW